MAHYAQVLFALSCHPVITQQLALHAGEAAVTPFVKQQQCEGYV